MPLSFYDKLQMFYVCGLKQRNTTAVANVNEYMPLWVWNELGYRIYVCGVTKGSQT
jgi:hypothetical protein